jgi:hypothetical protein
MPSDLEKWAIVEGQFLKEEIKWLEAGARLISPTGVDITAIKVKQLEARLDHVQRALNG